MKKLLTLLIAIQFSGNVCAKNNDSTKAELFSLMQERSILASDYYSSLEKKSGLFGGKTKNNLRDSQEKLVAIVKIDNKIMDALKRTIHFRNFEKASMTYDVTSFEERIRNLSILNDTLNKHLIKYSQESKMNQKIIKRNQIYLVGLIFLVLIMSGYIIKKNFLEK